MDKRWHLLSKARIRYRSTGLLIFLLGVSLLSAVNATAGANPIEEDISGNQDSGSEWISSYSYFKQERGDTETPAPRFTDTPVPRATDTPVPPPPRQATSTPTRPFILSTPTPTPTTPAESEESAPPPMPYSGGNTLTILGCEPEAEDVDLSVRRIYRHIPASGDSIPIPVQDGDFPGLFGFDLPDYEPGGMYALDLHLNSPDCPTGVERGIDTWMPGSSIHATFALPDNTTLLGSSLGKNIPGSYQGEIPLGGFWTSEILFSTTPKEQTQTFKWTTSAQNVVAGKLQASVLPFPSSTQGDLLNPPGMVADWDVTCGNCTFSVDVSILALEPPQGSPPASQSKVASFFKNAWQGIVQFFQQSAGWVQAFFGEQPSASQDPPMMGGASMQSDSSVNLVNAGKLVPPLITTYYFRVVPLHEGKVAGSASNPVRIEWNGEDPFAEAIAKGFECQQNPSAPGCPTPIPPPLKPFTVKIVGYHGVIAPVKGHQGCYIATKDTVVKWGPTEILYKAGQKFCPPEPEDKSWWEAIADFVVDAVNWASTAYNDLKNAVVSIVGQFVPDSLCGEKCLGTLLDVGLMALGMPPSIPNFDQLMNEGLDYLAAQAVSQLGVPQEVYDKLGPGATQLMISQAEEAWKAEAEKLIKDGMKQGLEAAQVGLSKSVSYVPDGVPVKPDPQGDYQPPTLILEVSRDASMPASADTCSGKTGTQGNLWVLTTVVVDEAAAQSFNIWVPTNQQMKAGQSYDLYQWMHVPMPNLAPGETQTIPVVLKPTFYNYWGAPWTVFNDARDAWGTWYWNGEMNLSVYNPCTHGDSLMGAANQSFGQ